MQETLTFLAFYQHIKHLSLALASYFANSTIYSRENNEFSKYLLVRSEFRKIQVHSHSDRSSVHSQ